MNIVQPLQKGIDYIGITVAVYCMNDKNEFVTVFRTQECRDEYETWDIIGGGIEVGETFEQAAKREVKEEIDCDLRDTQILGVLNVLRVQNKIPTHWIAVIMAGQVDPASVKIQETHKFSNWRWSSMNDLPKPLHSQFLIQLSYLKKYLSQT